MISPKKNSLFKKEEKEFKGKFLKDKFISTSLSYFNKESKDRTYSAIFFGKIKEQKTFIIKHLKKNTDVFFDVFPSLLSLHWHLSKQQFCNRNINKEKEILNIINRIFACYFYYHDRQIVFLSQYLKNIYIYSKKIKNKSFKFVEKIKTLYLEIKHLYIKIRKLNRLKEKKKNTLRLQSEFLKLKNEISLKLRAAIFPLPPFIRKLKYKKKKQKYSI